MKNLFLALVTLLSHTVAAVNGEPLLKNVFTRELYAIRNVNRDTPRDEIIEKFRVNKREHLQRFVINDLEAHLTERLERKSSAETKSLLLNLATIIATIPAATFAPCAAPALVTGNILLSDWWLGDELDEREINYLREKIESYLRAISNERIASLEEDFVVEKFRRPVLPCLSEQIEEVLLDARDRDHLPFGPEQFVKEALRLPHTCRKLSEGFASSADFIADAFKQDKPLAKYSGDAFTQLKSVLSNMNRRSIMDDGADASSLGTTIVIFDNENADSATCAKEIAQAAGVVSLCFNPQRVDGELAGTNRYAEISTKGELCELVTSCDNVHQNSVIIVDLNYLATKTEDPVAFAKSLLQKRQVKSEYFGVPIDLRRAAFVFVLKDIEESFRESFINWAFDYDLIEISSIEHEARLTMLKRYMSSNLLFTMSSITHEDGAGERAIALLVENKSHLPVKRMMMLLDNLNESCEDEWPERLGLLTSISSLKAKEACAQIKLIGLKESVEEKEHRLASITNDCSAKQEELHALNVVCAQKSAALKKSISLALDKVCANLGEVQLNNGCGFKLWKYELSIFEADNNSYHRKLAGWQTGDDVEVSVGFDCIYITNRSRNFSYLAFLHAIEIPTSDEELTERLINKNMATITTKSRCFERQFTVSIHDRSVIEKWQNSDLIIVGKNSSWIDCLNSRNLILINVTRPKISGHYQYVRADLDR